jgi:hypothetical protein
VTAEPQPPLSAANAPDDDLDSALESYDAYEEAEGYEDEDDLDDEPVEERRGWPLGTLLAVALGVWMGRWFYRLPDGLEAVAGLGLVLATALLAAGLYRRWVRRQMAAARARRRR